MTSPVENWTAERTALAGSLNGANLCQWQTERIREVIAYARKNSRHYHEKLRSIDPRAVLSLADLDNLPFTFPADITADPVSFLCVPQGEVARVTTLTTSGTSGFKKRIFFTERDLERTVDFFACGMQTLVSTGEHALILMSGETENSISRLLQTGLLRSGVTSCIGRPDWSPNDTIAAAGKADCIVGIPSQIIYLCRKDTTLRPKTVLLSADFVPQCVIAAIEKNWQCRVFTHYGLTETGFGCAVQCAVRKGHHLRYAELLLEIVDPQTGKSLPAGVPGEIVITTLRNEAMPLIRYRTGDMSRMLAGPCGCGSTLPRLDRVAGRRENDISLSNGSVISIHQLDELLFGMPEVYGFEATLRSESGRSVLALTVEADGNIEKKLSAGGLFKGLSLEVHYEEVPPFPIRAKRTIHLG